MKFVETLRNIQQFNSCLTETQCPHNQDQRVSMFRAIVTVYSPKRINTFSGENTDFLIVKEVVHVLTIVP